MNMAITSSTPGKVCSSALHSQLSSLLHLMSSHQDLHEWTWSLRWACTRASWAMHQSQPCAALQA